MTARERFTLFDNKPYGVRAVGIVMRDDKILLIHRVRDGKEFHVFPGGGLDSGETIQQAIVRELAEETNQTVAVDHILYHLDFIDDSDQYFGLCHWLGGAEVRLNGEEAERQNVDNQYHPLWVPIADIANLTLYPTIVKEWLLDDLKTIREGGKPFRHLRSVFTRPHGTDSSSQA